MAHVLSAGHGDEGEVGVVPRPVQVRLRPRAHHALHRVPVAGQGRHLATNHSSYNIWTNQRRVLWPADQSQLTWTQYSSSGPIRGEYCGQLTNHSLPANVDQPATVELTLCHGLAPAEGGVREVVLVPSLQSSLSSDKSPGLAFNSSFKKSDLPHIQDLAN